MRASIAGYMIPIVALVLGVLVLDEDIAAVQIVGVVVALAGGYILSKGREPAAPAPADEELAVEETQVFVNLDGTCTIVEKELVEVGAEDAA